MPAVLLSSTSLTALEWAGAGLALVAAIALVREWFRRW